jgi:hypothetical protein
LLIAAETREIEAKAGMVRVKRVIVSRTAVPAFLEHKKGYVVTDMDKNDFEVTLSGGLLTIRGEKKESSDSFCLSEGTTDYSSHSGSWRTLTRRKQTRSSLRVCWRSDLQRSEALQKNASKSRVAHDRRAMKALNIQLDFLAAR